MTKKILIALLSALPLMSLAQVKPGIPISDVVRQAQLEVVTQKSRPVDKSNRVNVRSQQTTISNDAYNPNDIDFGNAKSNQTRMRPEKIAKPAATRNTDFDEQLDFTKKFGLSLSTNGLMWAVAVPNLGVQFQYDKFSLVGSFGYAGWNMPQQKFWWITSLGGEFRYDILPNLYVGVAYNWFNYNIKFGANGNQGLAQSASAVVGYKLPIGRKLALDFGIGLGYALVGNEKYHEEGTAFVRDENRTFGYWGPTKVQVSLVWRIF